MDTNHNYHALIDYLNTRDTEERRRKKHRLPIEQYTRSDGEFFFTICARHCGQPFTDRNLANAIVEALLWRRAAHGWMLPCYCLMPDHLHFIVRLPEKRAHGLPAGALPARLANILDQVGSFKSYTTSQIWWKLGAHGNLWQRSSYDRVIRYNQSLDAVSYYVLNNPVRKGLCDRWEDYPYAAIVDPW